MLTRVTGKNQVTIPAALARASDRLPLADACIAACAGRHGLVLLHGDSHYAALPASVEAIDIRTV